MRRSLLLWLTAALTLACLSSPAGVWSAEVEKPRAGIAVWDTGQASATALPPAALAARKGWTRIASGDTAASFKGDAVLTNGRILAVLRKRDSAMDVHSVEASGSVARLRLLAGNGDLAARLDRLTVRENHRGAVALEAAYQTAKGEKIIAKFRLKRGEVAVQAEAGSGGVKLRVECAGRFVLLPDFFADDVAIDARKLPASPSAEVPSENFLLHLAGSGDAIAVCVFENREQDVKLMLAGDGDRRVITASEIGFGGKKIWVGLMAAPRVWHAAELKPSAARKVVPLDWKMPFPAQWRVDFTRPNGLVDGWDMLLPMPKGDGYIKPAWFGGPQQAVRASRKRFTETLGDFFYPCWADREGRGYVQPLRVKTRTQFVSVLKYEGPVILYPFNRVAETPPDVFTFVDVARNALGVGPCDYILDLEAQKPQYKGKATCPTRDLLLAIYQKGEQKKRRDQIEKALQDALVFVRHIRERITLYLECGQRIRRYLAEQKKAHPELAGAIAELEKIAQEMEARFKEREERVKTPEYVVKMNESFRQEVLDYQGPDALERCKKYADALTKIGGNQDKLVSECRWVARVLRQRAGILVALDPRMAPIAAEIRTRTQEVLRNPSAHESPRQ